MLVKQIIKDSFIQTSLYTEGFFLNTEQLLVLFSSIKCIYAHLLHSHFHFGPGISFLL